MNLDPETLEIIRVGLIALLIIGTVATGFALLPKEENESASEDDSLEPAYSVDGRLIVGFEIRDGSFRTWTGCYGGITKGEYRDLLAREADGEEIRFTYGDCKPKTREELEQAFRSASNYQDYLDGKL